MTCSTCLGMGENCPVCEESSAKKSEVSDTGMKVSFQPSNQEIKPHDILAEMAETFKQRNAVYGDNYKMVADLMCVLHPNGFNQLSNQDHELGHLWSLLIVKLSRFAISGLTHKDSIHDLAVYGAMIEAILTNREQEDG